MIHNISIVVADQIKSEEEQIHIHIIMETLASYMLGNELMETLTFTRTIR